MDEQQQNEEREEHEEHAECACCHTMDPARGLRHRNILTQRAVFTGEPRAITLCDRCYRSMPFAIDELIAIVDRHSMEQSAEEAMFEDFLRKYISQVWPEDIVPSYQHLCKVLNAVGLYTRRGVKWEYHNLNQRMARLDIDRDEILRMRVKTTYAQKMKVLMDKAVEWELNMRANNAGVIETREDLPAWVEAEPSPLLEDMPQLAVEV